jgi:hypothetical protein
METQPKQKADSVNKKQNLVELLISFIVKTGVISSIDTAKVRGSYQAIKRRLV